MGPSIYYQSSYPYRNLDRLVASVVRCVLRGRTYESTRGT